MESSGALCERLRERGYAVTPQRRTIFEVLEGAKHHPSAEQVFDEVRRRLPDVSLATVYKTLKELVRMGELQELNYHSDRSRFDPRVDPHSHVTCQTCGRVEDVELCLDRLDLSPTYHGDFTVERYEIVFYGTCGDCRRGQVSPQAD